MEGSSHDQALCRVLVLTRKQKGFHSESHSLFLLRPILKVCHVNMPYVSFDKCYLSQIESFVTVHKAICEN